MENFYETMLAKACDSFVHHNNDKDKPQRKKILYKASVGDSRANTLKVNNFFDISKVRKIKPFLDY